MKKRKIGFIALLGFLAVSAISVTTYAWFTQNGAESNVEFKAGLVKFEVNTNLKGNETPVVPGVDFLNGKELGFTNSSTIDTQLRVKVSYTITPLVIDDSTTELNPIEGKEFTTDDYIVWNHTDNASTWVLNGGYYYYGAAELDDAKTEASKIESTDNSISFFSTNDTLTLNGNLVGNGYQGATIKITFTFQAKQYDVLKWTDCAEATFDFETGLKKKA